jgi:drug resistance transporter, EmrB/QacA subfamily
MFGELTKKRKMIVFLGVIMAMLLSSLDSTIVSTAMPKVLTSLGGVEYLSWVFTAYMLASTISVPIFGKLADIYGRKPFYIAGVVVFLLGSALCGISGTMTQLILFRALQGVGGGMMMSNSMAIIADIFPPQERASKQGIIGAVFGLSAIIGPAIGGFITDNLNWRWVFYVNIPVGIVAIVILIIGLPFVKDAVERKIDYLGATFIISTFTPMLLAFSWAGSKYTWGSKEIIGLLIFSLISLIVLIFTESKAKEPIIPLSLFKSATFNVSVLAGLLMSVAMFGISAYVPLFVQGVMGETATNSGVITTPMMISAIIASTISGQLISKLGKYKLNAIVGFAIMSIGMYLMSTMGISTTHTQLIISMLVLGFGLGLIMPIFVIAVQNAFPHKMVGTVTASVTFFRNIGGTIGVAILGSILNAQFKSGSASVIPEAVKKIMPMEQQKIFETPQTLFNSDVISQISAHLPSQAVAMFTKLLDDLKGVLSNSIHTIFLYCMFVAIAGFILVFFLPENPLRQTNNEEENEVSSEKQELVLE